MRPVAGPAARRTTCSPTTWPSGRSTTPVSRGCSPSCWRSPVRPRQLEVEGFTAFRERAVVDFEDADLFAFTGPTGSGKSSLVDAMGFALFGRVHRYGEKLVHPAISSGSTEARVRLDFTVGVTDYTAVRVVRRTGPGRASTKEARLERAGEVVAGDEKSLTAAIEDLLGLDFEQYCRCVVLPQGAFAAFLHDTPKGRQDLLTGLLDLRHYREMAQMAGRRAADAESRGSFLDERLTRDLADATPEALAEADRRIGALERLAQRLVDAAPRLEEAAAGAREAASRANELEGRMALLSSVAAPPDLSELGAAIAAAADRLNAATKALEEAETDVSRREAEREKLGDRTALDAARAAHRRRVDIVSRRERAVEVHEGASAAAATARQAAEAAERHRAEMEQELEAVRQANRAHVLAADLVAGGACPVCR